jgi:hypothetical protein
MSRYETHPLTGDRIFEFHDAELSRICFDLRVALLMHSEAESLELFIASKFALRDNSGVEVIDPNSLRAASILALRGKRITRMTRHILGGRGNVG